MADQVLTGSSASRARAPAGIRARLLEAGRLSPVEIETLLSELGLSGTETFDELPPEVTERVSSHLGETLRPPFAGYLERVRALLDLYRRRYGRILDAAAHPSSERLATLLAGPGPEVAGGSVPAPAPGGSHWDAGFEALAASFGLGPCDRDLLWLLLAPEVLPEVQWLYDALLRGPSGPGLPVGFLRTILAAVHPPEEVERALSAGGPSRRLRVVVPGAMPGSLRCAPRIVEHLLAGWDGVPAELAHLIETTRDLGPLPPDGVWSPSGMDEAIDLGATAVAVIGPKGGGEGRIAATLASRLGRPLATVDHALFSEDRDTVVEVIREVTLVNAVLLVRGAAHLAVGAPGAREAFLSLAKGLPLVLGLGPAPSLELVVEVAARLSARVIQVGLPDPSERARIWAWALEAHGLDRSEELVSRLRAYPLGVDHITEACSVARLLGGPGSHEERLTEACQHLVGHRLGAMATRVKTRATWKDLVLPKETKDKIEELVNFALLSRKVLDEQGYGRKLSYGKGLTALFSGPSGTGKTMVAGLIAARLGIELYAVDLSRMVSKYIGETEQRLAELFSEAKASGAALLFDEADSLFGSRTEVKSSTDRYANLEVNFLLQKMEEHDGVVFLTTNFPRSIDKAFLRRLRFKIHFPTPDAKARQRLWERMIPKDAPRRKNLRLKQLAEEFELSGGAIRNAILRAAFQAAAQKEPLSHAHLVAAAIMEYEEMGRLVRV